MQDVVHVSIVIKHRSAYSITRTKYYNRFIIFLLNFLRNIIINNYKFHNPENYNISDFKLLY